MINKRLWDGENLEIFYFNSIAVIVGMKFFITTGRFFQQAKDEASAPEKQQIDLIDGEDFMNKLVEYGIGVKEITTYEVDDAFFKGV